MTLDLQIEQLNGQGSFHYVSFHLWQRQNPRWNNADTGFGTPIN